MKKRNYTKQKGVGSFWIFIPFIIVFFIVASAYWFPNLYKQIYKAKADIATTYPLPGSCPTIACPSDLTCKDKNCVQCGDASIFPSSVTSSLKEYARKRGLLVGAYFPQCKNFPACVSLFEKEYGDGGIYNSQNTMKTVMPQQNTYDFTKMDTDIAFAQSLNLRIHHSHLLWKAESSPRWLFPAEDGSDCGTWTSAQLDTIMHDYINKVTEHGGDRYFAWNVINEGRTQSCWYKKLGETGYINAFKYAREKAPTALLVLNDFYGGNVNPDKVTYWTGFVQRAKSKGASIDAMGIQMHVSSNTGQDTLVNGFRNFLEKTKSVGVKAMITEMDVAVPSGATDADFLAQKQIYKKIVKTCLEYPHCISFATWGVTDQYTWLTQSLGRADTYPLLFDQNYARKPAYYGVMEALSENTTRSCTAVTTPVVTPTLTATNTPTPTPTGTQTVWFDQAWKKRKPITIKNNSTSALSDYQVQLTINYDSDMQTNFADIRFTDATGINKINHWTQGIVSGSTATVWVKVPNIPASGTTTIYMYYGNSTIGSASSGATTFIAFDGNFTGSYTKIGSGNGTYSVTNGEMTMTETAANDGLDHGYIIFPSVSLVSGTQEVRANFQPTVLRELHGVSLCNTGVDNFYKFAGSQAWGTNANVMYSGSGLKQVRFVVNATCNGYVAIVQDDDQYHKAASKYTWIFIKKYVSAEPTATFGSESSI